MGKELIILNNWEKAKQAISVCKNIDEVKAIRDKTEALRAYAKQAREGLEVQNNIADIKLRCERKIGEFSRELPVAQGNARFNTSHDGKYNILKEAGIKHYERYEIIANLPQDLFDKHISDIKASNEELTTVGVIKLARELQGKNKKEALPLPEGKFSVIYADPPWKYNDECKEGAIQSGGATRHYPTMSIKELSDLKIPSADNAVLFLWTTSPLLEECFKVINSWGFQYKTSFVWDKVKHNMGHYNSVRHEFLLICVKGNFTPQNPKLYDSVYSEEKKKHSQKPEKFYEIIETLYPQGKYLELFARAKRRNWLSWGNEL